jgi:hypothetical protein
MCGYYANHWSRPIVTARFFRALRKDFIFRLRVSKCGSYRIACGQIETVKPANPKPLAPLHSSVVIPWNRRRPRV